MSAISLFEEKQVRRAWNASEEKWYFSIDDVVLALALKPSLSLLFDEAIAVLTHPENDYDACTGLKRAHTPADPTAFML